MTIKQSNWTKGINVTATSDCSGEVVCERFTFTITENLTTSDIIELGVLPAFATVVDAILDTDECGTCTIAVGVMSGSVGSTDGARTSGTELFAAAADASVVRPSTRSAFTIAPTDKDRSIGLKFSAAVTAANQVVALTLFYKQ